MAGGCKSSGQSNRHRPCRSMTVTLLPLCETVPFHELLMVCPFAKLQANAQLLKAVVPLFLMVMVAPK